MENNKKMDKFMFIEDLANAFFHGFVLDNTIKFLFAVLSKCYDEQEQKDIIAEAQRRAREELKKMFGNKEE